MKIELTPVPLHMEADPARLTQVVGNLINNASKFTELSIVEQVKIVGHIRKAFIDIDKYQ